MKNLAQLLSALTLLAIPTTAQTTTSSSAPSTITAALPAYIFGDNQQYVASILSAANGATTYTIDCPADVDTSICSPAPGQTTITQSGSTVLQGLITDGPAFSYSWSCSLTAAATELACLEQVGGSEANFPGTSMTTATGTDAGVIPITVTAGLEKLVASTSLPVVTASSSKPGTASGLAATSAGKSAASVGGGVVSGTSSRSASAVSATASSSAAGARQMEGSSLVVAFLAVVAFGIL